MGGANVAVANDATAAYWNPAAFGFFKGKGNDDYAKRNWSVSAFGGAGEQIHEDLGESLDKIFNTDFNNINTGNISANKMVDFLNITNSLNQFNSNSNRAAEVTMNGGLGLQVGNFGLGGYVFSDISAKGNLDLVNIAPVSSSVTSTDVVTAFSTASNFNGGSSVPAGDYYLSASQKTSLAATIAAMPNWNSTAAANFVQAVDYGLSQAQTSGYTIPADVTTTITNVAQVASSAVTGGSIANNTSSLYFKGIAIGEVPLTYGRAFGDNFSLGGNIKYMKARTYNTQVQIFNTDFSSALSTAKNNYTDSQTFGVDMGALYRSGDKFRIGIVARNVNSPSFDVTPLASGDSSSMKEKPQIRAGIAYKPFDSLTLALDYDVTKNDTNVSDSYKSQNLGGGLEFNVYKVIQLRGGFYKNMAQNDIGPVYTGGIGLNLWLVNIDVGASVSPKSTTVDNNTIQKEIRGELAVSALF